MILVTGATGNVGGALVSRLSTAGVPVRALVRSRPRGDDLRGFDVDLAVGTYEDEAALREAARGVDRVFLLSPAGEQMAEQELAVVRAVQAEAPGAHVVKLAAAGVDAPGESPVRLVREHQRVVQGLRDAGLPTTVLAPGTFMQNVLAQASSVCAGVVRGGPGASSWVDVRDVAAVAAHVLTSEGHDGATYTVTGPAAVTLDDVAATMTRVLGHEVRAEETGPEQLRDDLLSAGVPAWVAEGLRELAEVAAAGGAATVTDEVQKATGSPARSLEQFLEEHRAVFTPR